MMNYKKRKRTILVIFIAILAYIGLNFQSKFVIKVRLISVSILLLFIINSCSIHKKDITNEINKEGYAVNFIEYDKKYEIDIDNDGETDSVKVFINADGYISVEVNNHKKTIGYGEEGVKSVIINDNNGNYCIGIAIHYVNDTRISEFYRLNKENIVYMSAVDGYIKSAYQNLGLYVEDRKYIIGFQNTRGIYLINSDLKLSLEGNYIINDSKHTLVKELKAYKYNDKTAVYEITTYHKGEALYLYETNMQNLIYFKTENGDKGYINATKDDYESTTGEFYIEEERLVDYFDGEEISWAG